MKRFYLAAAGLCVAAPCWAQEGALAPTAPVVPVPELKNGSLVAPGGGPGGPGIPVYRPAGYKFFDSLGVEAGGNICVATIGESGISVVSRRVAAT